MPAPLICRNTFIPACSLKSPSIFQRRHEELAILRENLPFADEQVLNYVTDFLQHAHASDERYTVRDGVNIARFALKLASSESIAPNPSLLRIAIEQTLGEEALAVYPQAGKSKRRGR